MSSQQRTDAVEFFDISSARWVVRVLGMLIAVVGQESLVGLLLRQTRFEILSFIRDEQSSPDTPSDPWFLNN